MKINSKKKFLTGSATVILLLTWIIYSKISVENTFFVTFFGILSNLASLYGIIVAVLQIQSVKQINEKTNSSVDESLRRINQLISVSDLSKASKIIEEIQTSIREEKHEVSLIRMRDLKKIIIEIKFNDDLKEYTDRENYSKNILDLGLYISNIDDLISGRKKKY